VIISKNLVAPEKPLKVWRLLMAYWMSKATRASTYPRLCTQTHTDPVTVTTCTEDTVRVEDGKSVNDQRQHLVLRLRMSGATPPLAHKPVWRVREQLYFRFHNVWAFFRFRRLNYLMIFIAKISSNLSAVSGENVKVKVSLSTTWRQIV
jgi:hypothetical protein